MKKGGSAFLEFTVNNTAPASFIDTYKIKTLISVPSTIASVAATGHLLPTGWIIIINDGLTITLSQ